MSQFFLWFSYYSVAFFSHTKRFSKSLVYKFYLYGFFSIAKHHAMVKRLFADSFAKKTGAL